MLPTSAAEVSTLPVSELVTSASAEPLLDEGEEARLTAAFASGDATSVVRLVRPHLRVAVDEAIRNRGLGQRTEYLVRVATLALLEAAPSYDPFVHGRFSMYARRVVRRAIDDEMAS